MARPRTFSVDDVVFAAKDAFWARGYGGTAISDLEDCTGLNRSSIYQAFGSKRELFDLALAAYIDGFVEPLLEPLQRPGSSMSDIEGFFGRLKSVLRTNRMASRHGCLWFNSITEVACRSEGVDVRADEYRDRLRAAFANALKHKRHDGRANGHGVQTHARLLMGTTFGFWLVVRIDRAAATSLCDATVAEVRTWA